MWIRRLVLCGLTMGSAIAAAAIDRTTDEMSSDKTQLLQVDDEASSLKFAMEVLKDADGGAYALRVTVRKGMVRDDVALRLNDDRSLAFMVAIADTRGEMRSKPSRTITTDTGDPLQHQSFSVQRITQDSTYSVLIPLVDCFRTIDDVADMPLGRLVLNISFGYRSIRASDPIPDASLFMNRMVTLFDHRVIFTPAALKGNAKEKYELQLGRERKGTTNQKP